jgi:hypothetical protein
MWTAIAAICGLASLAGYALFQDSSPPTVGLVLAFPAGAILTMLANTMMPEAFEAQRQAGRRARCAWPARATACRRRTCTQDHRPLWRLQRHRTWGTQPLRPWDAERHVYQPERSKVRGETGAVDTASLVRSAACGAPPRPTRLPQHSIISQRSVGRGRKDCPPVQRLQPATPTWRRSGPSSRTGFATAASAIGRAT